MSTEFNAGEADTATANEISSTAAEETATEDAPPPSGERKRLSGVRKRLGAILLALLLLTSAGVAAWLYVFSYRVDQQTDAETERLALEAATTGTVALLSYSPDNLEGDFAEARSQMTGDFLDYYTQFTEQIVTPAAKQKQVQTSAEVVQAGVAELRPDSATVLIFVNQMTTSTENPDGAFAASAVKVGLTKVDGRWLINTFNPV